MNQPCIKLNDISFLGDKSSSKMFAPRAFEWYRGALPSYDDKLVVFTDMCLGMSEYTTYKNSKRIAWILEPYVISPGPYDYIVSGGYKNFDIVFSHHNSLLKRIPNGKWYPNGMCWIKVEDHNLYPKSKTVNIFASGKNYAPGHKIRHKVIELLKDRIDVFGYGYNPVDYKIDGLKDYKYSITIENCIEDEYWTEKLIDNFVTGTIPIYFGPKYIGRFFNTNGVLFAQSIEEIIKQIDFIESNPDHYNSQVVQDAIRQNFESAKDFLVPENYIFEKYLKNVV